MSRDLCRCNRMVAPEGLRHLPFRSHTPIDFPPSGHLGQAMRATRPATGPRRPAGGGPGCRLLAQGIPWDVRPSGGLPLIRRATAWLRGQAVACGDRKRMGGDDGMSAPRQELAVAAEPIRMVSFRYAPRNGAAPRNDIQPTAISSPLTRPLCGWRKRETDRIQGGFAKRSSSRSGGRCHAYASQSVCERGGITKGGRPWRWSDAWGVCHGQAPRTTLDAPAERKLASHTGSQACLSRRLGMSTRSGRHANRAANPVGMAQ